MPDVNKDVIKEALGKLSADNDNHWTADGKPKVETVKLFSQGQAVDRAYLDENFPDFNRTNTDVETDGTDVEIKDGTDANTETAPATSAEGSNVSNETQPQDVPLTAGAEGEIPTPAVDGVQGSITPPSIEDPAPVESDGSASGDKLSVSLLHAVDEEIAKLDENASQNDIDLLVQQIHAVQQGLHGRLKSLDEINARTAGEVKKESHASLMRKMRESQGTATKTVEEVERYKYAVDQPKGKQPLR